MALRIVGDVGCGPSVDPGKQAALSNNLDLTDRKILAVLQRNATISLVKVSESVGLTSTACWRRIKKLEERGIIAKRVTLLDPRQLGLTLSGYVMIRTSNHGKEWIERFLSAVANIPAVVELHRTTGNVDYLLKIVAPDLTAYNSIYHAISEIPDIEDVNAVFSMESIKFTTELPLDF